MGQLGNRVQHALRAFTARDKKALRLAAETYRENPAFDIETAITEVGVGEAVTSFLEDKGVPGVAERTLIRPPCSQLGPITAAERAALLKTSHIAGKYEAKIDRASAFEALKARADQAALEAAEAEAKEEDMEPVLRDFSTNRRYTGTRVTRSTSRTTRRQTNSFQTDLTNMVMKELTGTTGRRIVRGVLGGLFKGR